MKISKLEYVKMQMIAQRDFANLENARGRVDAVLALNGVTVADEPVSATMTKQQFIDVVNCMPWTDSPKKYTIEAMIPELEKRGLVIE